MIHHGGRANCLGCCMLKAVWLKSLINDILLLPKHVPPTSFHYDYQVAITRAKSKNYNEERRYLTMRHKSIRHTLSHSCDFCGFVR